MASQQEDTDQVYARLTDRDLEIIDCLASHRLLTSTMLTTLFFPSRRTASARLVMLNAFGIVTRFRAQPSRTYYYSLDWHGQAIAALRRSERPPTRQAALWETRRLIVSGQRRHLEGVNSFMTLAHMASRDRGAKVIEWASEAQAATEFTHLRPDGAATIRFANDRVVSFWLEYDTATQSLARLAAKVRRYRPGRLLLAVVPRQTRRQNLLNAARAGGEVSLWVASEESLPALLSSTTDGQASPLLTQSLWHGCHGEVVSLDALVENARNLTPAGVSAHLQ